MRYDKYDGVSGGFRAVAEANCPENEFNLALGASINASGRMVTKSAGTTGYVGLVIRDRTKRRAGNVQDIMQHGEIVLDSDETQLTAGTTYYLDPETGLLSTTESRYHVGHTVESFRLVVRFTDQGVS